MRPLRSRISSRKRALTKRFDNMFSSRSQSQIGSSSRPLAKQLRHSLNRAVASLDQDFGNIPSTDENDGMTVISHFRVRLPCNCRGCDQYAELAMPNAEINRATSRTPTVFADASSEPGR